MNSKRGVLAKVKMSRGKSEVKRNRIANKNGGYQPYFKDWKLDEEIRLLQQL